MLKGILGVLLEALKASSALSGTKVIIKLAAAETRVYLEFKCEVPEEDGSFSYEKQVDVNIEKNADNIIPKIPNSIECELACVHHLQQMILPLTGDLTLVHICLSVDTCHICKNKDKRDLEYVFSCNHNRKAFKLPEIGKLTVLSQETSPLQIASCYYNLSLQEGQCSLYNIVTLVKAKDLGYIFQKATSLNWNKVMLGIEHDSDIIVTACWKESLFIRFLATAHIEE